MSEIRKGRWTARRDEPYVVFLIGMRVNKLWKVGAWLPIMFAMPRMLRELSAKPELGLLGGQAWFGRTILMVQYWSSFEALEAYAKSRDNSHLAAWTAFNRAIGSNGDVGVYHETYRVAPGACENIYVNMPATLFGAVGELVEAKGAYTGARGRMGKREEAPAPAPV
jgi:hypothetical protein